MNKTSSMDHRSETNNCAILGITQIAVGFILLLASFYGFTVLQSNIVMLPALMSVALIGNGIRSLLVKCADIKTTSLA